MKLAYLKFSEPFLITDLNLETINLNLCENIYFDNKKLTKNIKFLELNNTNITIGSKYRFDNIEDLNITNSKIDIDFTSLKKIKKIKSNQIK
jgi:hypothetical protein